MKGREGKKIKRKRMRRQILPQNQTKILSMAKLHVLWLVRLINLKFIT